MPALSAPKFSIGEVAILQPPHPSARHLWGQETKILSVIRSSGSGEDAMGLNIPHWSYVTDIQAPPPSDLPEHQHRGWVWCEYDLRKKYDPGSSFDELIEELNKELVEEF